MGFACSVLGSEEANVQKRFEVFLQQRLKGLLNRYRLRRQLNYGIIVDLEQLNIGQEPILTAHESTAEMPYFINQLSE
jgi:hypothetical protein